MIPELRNPESYWRLESSLRIQPRNIPSGKDRDGFIRRLIGIRKPSFIDIGSGIHGVESLRIQDTLAFRYLKRNKALIPLFFSARSSIVSGLDITAYVVFFLLSSPTILSCLVHFQAVQRRVTNTCNWVKSCRSIKRETGIPEWLITREFFK